MKNLIQITSIMQNYFYILLFTIIALYGCGENDNDRYDRWLSELDCPVVLEAKTDKAVLNPTIVVRDGKGKIRTIEYMTGGGMGICCSNMATAISDSREVGDTLKPCVGKDGK